MPEAVQLLEHDGRLEFIAKGGLCGSCAGELEDRLEDLADGDVMVVGDKPMTVIVYRPCAVRIKNEISYLITEKIQDC